MFASRFIFVILSALLLLTVTGCKKSAPEPVHVPVVAHPGIGVGALGRIVRFCELGPRDALTPGAEKAAGWIRDELVAAGLQPEVRTFEDPTPAGARRTYRNVVAEVPGTGTGRVVLLSHYDTKSGISPDFVGANDGGSSTGLLLELADYIHRNPCRQTVVFAFVDGEECAVAFNDHDGLRGSKKLAAEMSAGGEKVDAVILLDMIGDADLCLTLPRNSTAKLKTLVLDAAEAQRIRNKVKLAPYDILDDHQPFLDAGFPAVDLIDFSYGSAPGLMDYWHTPKDTVDKLSASSLQDMALLVLEMISRL